MNKNTIVSIVALIAIVATAFYALNKKPQTMDMDMEHTNESTSQTTETPDTSIARFASSTRLAQNGDVVIVNYTGTLKDGTKFDSSYDRGQPFGLILGKGMVISGWEEGLMGTKKGDKKHLIIPPAKGYGAQEIKDAAGKIIIPKNSTLVFDVEVVEVIPADQIEKIMAEEARMQAVPHAE